MANGISIQYGDVAPEAKENFDITVSEKQFETIQNLKRYNMEVNNYANPCEMYQTLLDGTAVALPSDINTANIGLWSKQLSNTDGTFTTPITITLESQGQYSSQGFTFTFDKYNNIFPIKLTIQWYRVTDEGTEDLSNGAVEFNPTSGFYFCRKQIENFNKVVIKFYSLNMPNNRLKLEVIDYGYGTVFYGGELRNVKITQSIDPISSEITINTCDFSLDSKSDMVYSFQSKQPLTVKFNDKLRGTMFVKSSTRKASFLWDINAEDYITFLDTTNFVGGMYTNEKASTILENIFKTAKVPYNIADELYDFELTGYIPYTTCREALMQVCFASMAVVNTTVSDVVEVQLLDTTVSQKIPLRRIMQGQSFSDNDTITKVQLTSYTYTPKAVEDDNRINLYKAPDSGAGNNITVIFSEPIHDLYTTGGGDIIESGTNYAIINATETFYLNGYGYDVKTKEHERKNPVVLASEKENVKSITSATLISNKNVDKVLENCYNWLIKTNETKMRIIEGKNVTRETKPVKFGQKKFGTFKFGQVDVIETVTNDEPINVGETITAETEYLGDVTGIITSQSYSLNGNIIIKDVVIK